MLKNCFISGLTVLTLFLVVSIFFDDTRIYNYGVGFSLVVIFFGMVGEIITEDDVNHLF